MSDNGLQFDSNAFRKYCSELGIRNIYSTPAYPQGNGQAEAVNKVIVNGLKKRLDAANRRWVARLVDLLEHTMINKRDAFCHDLWGRGCNPPRGKLPNVENELLHSKR